MIETRTANTKFDSEDSSVSTGKFLSAHSSVQSSESKKRKIKSDIFDTSEMDADGNNSSFLGEVIVKSRYGRTRKPKISDDFLPTDKKVGAILGHSPKQSSSEKLFPHKVSSNIRSKGRRLFETLHGSEHVSKVQKTGNKLLKDKDTHVKVELTASNDLGASMKTDNISGEITDTPEKNSFNCSEDQDVEFVDNGTNIKVIDLESDKLADSEYCTNTGIFETDNLDGQTRVLSNIANDQRISETRESFSNLSPVRSVIMKSQRFWGYKKKLLKRVRSKNQTSLSLNLNSSILKENDSNNDSVPIKVEPNSKGLFLKVLAFTEFNPSNVVAGDLVWARVSGYPFWPALITLDKETQSFVKLKGCGRINSVPYLHVQFFKDMGRHSWLPFTSIVEYAALGLGDENDYQLVVKNRDPKISSAFKVKAFQQAKFMDAVNESEEMVEMSREQRLQTFSDRYNSVQVLQEKRRQSLSKKRKQMEVLNEFVEQPKKIKVEIEDEWSETDNNASSILDHSREIEPTKEKKISMELRINAISKSDKRFKKFYSKNLSKISDEHPDLPKPRLEKLLWDKWSNLSETEKTKALTHVKHEIKKEWSPKASGSDESSVKKTLWNNRQVAGGLFRGMRKEKVCQICLTGGSTVKCRGQCCGMYHVKCVFDLLSLENGKKMPDGIETKIKNTPENNDNLNDSVTEPNNIKEKEGDQSDTFLCHNCSRGQTPCFVCKKSAHNNDSNTIIGCGIGTCEKFFHLDCLKAWPQTVYNGGKLEKPNSDKPTKIACPQHKCHTCASDDPRSNTLRFTNETLVRCVSCPTAYHTGDYCVPAGSEILNSTQIICAQHYIPVKRKNIHVNACWCFLCGMAGGTLICCDLCPSAFHPACLMSSPPEGGYICEDCETGRYPIFGEIVWAKCGSYRWWPARILYPNEIPGNVLKLPHKVGQFCVRFYGSHDHFWVNRGRVFLFQDGDDQDKVAGTKTVDKDYRRALKEVNEAVKQFNIEKGCRNAKSIKPPVYIKIKSNKPVGNVRQVESSPSSLTPCDCDPSSENPCGPDSDCLNRILLVECSSEVCRAGTRCGNQCFEKRLYPDLKPYLTQNRGWGLKAMQDLKKGQFVIEYVGEMINEEEYRRRVEQKHQRKEENFYFLTIDKDRMLDAGPKGNVARFMNHSCQPNCETQKWTVNGDTRVGLFALEDIPANTELTFNYNLECIGTDKKLCMCGAPKCSGYIGVKASNKPAAEDEKMSLLKKQRHRKRCLGTEETTCFSCGDPGKLVICDLKTCPKGYHLECVNLPAPPKERWMCPWHRCNQCNKRTVQRCNMCTNSWCVDHAAGRIRSDGKNGYLCPYHDKGGNQKIEKNKSPIKGKAIKQETKTEDENVGCDSNTITKNVDEQIEAAEEVIDSADVDRSANVPRSDSEKLDYNKPLITKGIESTPVCVSKELRGELLDKTTNKESHYVNRPTEDSMGIAETEVDLNNEHLTSSVCNENGIIEEMSIFTSTPIGNRSIEPKRARGRPKKSESKKIKQKKTLIISKVKPKLNSDNSALDSELEQLALSFGSDPDESFTNESTPLQKQSNGVQEHSRVIEKVDSNEDIAKRKRGRPKKEMLPAMNNVLQDDSFSNKTCEESVTDICDDDSVSLTKVRTDSTGYSSGKRGRKPNKLYADYEDVPVQGTYAAVPKYVKTNKLKSKAPKNLKMVCDTSINKTPGHGNVPYLSNTLMDDYNKRELSPVLNGELSDVSVAEDLDHKVKKDVHCISSSLLLPVQS